MSSVSSFPKLQTVTEDLETVPIDSIPRHHSPILNRQVSTPTMPSSAKGLGIHVPRRPSDSILNKSEHFRPNSSKLSLMERPVSNDSILSANPSEFSQIGNDNSRNSSMTSGSISNSPIMKNNFSTSSIESKGLSMKATTSFGKSNSSSTPMSSESDLNSSVSSLSTIKLTPSQRLKVKRQNSLLNSRKQKETYFEDHYDSDEESSVFDNSLIWNVPYAGSSVVFSPVSGKSSTALKRIIEKSPIQMPMSPLPGEISNSLPSSPMISSQKRKGNFYRHPDEAQSLSRFYEATSNSYSKQEFNKRQDSATNLPAIVKRASDLGLDDMNLFSEEKMSTITSTRQIWLPPKDSKESKKHESDAIKMFEESVKVEKSKKERQDMLIEMEKKNVIRWGEIVDRGLLRKSSVNEIGKLVFKCSIPDHLRYEIWSSFLRFEIDKKKKNTELLGNYEKYEELIKKLQSIPNLPIDKVELMKDSIVKSKKENPSIFENTNDDQILELLKLRMISKLGLDSKIDLELMSLLLLKFNSTDSYNLTNLTKLNIFNNEAIKKKFNGSFNKNHTVKKYLQHEEYASDLQQLTFDKTFAMILKLTTKNKSFENDNEDYQLIFQTIDILIIHNDHYSFYSLMITILRHYHLGFSDIDDLLYNDGRKIVITDRFQFFEKIQHYYKKF